MYKIYTKKWGMSDVGHIRKIWLIMRLTTVILIASFLQVSASGFAQKISLSKSNVALKNVLKELRAQSGYNFVYTDNLLKKSKLVNVNVNNADLEDVLKIIFNEQPLTYSINRNTITVKEKEATFIENISDFFQQDSIIYRGKVIDETGKAMPGATVRIQGTNKITKTNNAGEFAVRAGRKGGLEISYVGFSNQVVTLNGLNPNDLITVKMNPGQSELNEVEVVSTGYYDLDRTRMTGSAEVITAKQLQHSNDPNLLKRLVGITTALSVPSQSTLPSGLSFTNRNSSSVLGVTIRGQNSLTTGAIGAFGSNGPESSGLPLVVIDGIASDGVYDLNQLNPDNVLSVTILKDAAASSIWGSRASNGVIVVKTKRGSYGQPASVSFNGNYNYTEKPDLFYNKKMSVSDYIDAQITLFNRAGTVIANPTVGSAQGATGNVQRSPVAEILNDWKNLHIIGTEAEAMAKIDALRGNDIRNDLTKYVLRNSLSQNYSLAISGGSKALAYSLFGGYNNTQGKTLNNSNEQVNLGYSASVKPFKNMEIKGAVGYNQGHQNYQGVNSSISTDYNAYPIYTRLADDNGNPLAIPRGYRDKWKALLNTTYGNSVLDLTYIPLQDVNEGYAKDKSQSFNLNVNAAYKINPDLSANVTYSYNRNLINSDYYYSKDSWYMRDLINQFTVPRNALDPNYGTPYYLPALTRQIPLGGYLQKTFQTGTSNTLRGQINYNKTWNKRNILNALIGMDISQVTTDLKNNFYYGYDPNTLTTNNTLNFSTPVPILYSPFGDTRATIPSGSNSLQYFKNRTLGSFANLAYTLDNKYTISGSVRKDGSSVFGAGTNRTGTPFWSTGLSWSINNERFYKIDWLPQLALRATFGYNGNSNGIRLSRGTVDFFPGAISNGLQYGSVSSVVVNNNQYRPERSGTLNFGLDYGIKGGRVNGTFEYFLRRTKDLVTGNVLDPSTGFPSASYNTGDLQSRGIDMSINSQNIKAGKFRWNSTFLLSNNRVKLTKIYAPGALVAGDGIFGYKYTVGYDLSRLFAYPWAGLDPATGSPRIYLNGQALVIDDTQQGSNNLTKISNAPLSAAKYIGPGAPTYFGSFRNSFNYGALSVQFNILYKFKYFKWRPMADLALYNTVFTQANRILGAEFANRWQKPGDEAFTDVPSMTYPGSQAKDQAYQYADINTYKADHFRLQEVNLSYGITTPKSWFLKNPRVYMNLPVNVIIWRANKLGIDPEAVDVPQPKVWSLGFNTSF